MPNYLFRHPEEDKYIEVIQGMNDEHVFFDQEGVEWKRVWTVPQAIVSSISDVDPFDRRAQLDKTANMKGSVGDLWDISKEMSEKRSDKIGGMDPIKQKYFSDYEKKNKCKHFEDRANKIETKDAVIDFSAPSPDIEL